MADRNLVTDYSAQVVATHNQIIVTHCFVRIWKRSQKRWSRNTGGLVTQVIFMTGSTV